MRPFLPTLFITCLMSTAAYAEWTEDAENCADVALAAEETIQACTRAIDSGSLDQIELANTLYNRARTLVTEKKYAEAVDDFNRALALNDLDPAYYVDRASVFRKLKQYDNAVTDYTKAIAMGFQPVFGAYFNRGVAYFYGGDKEAAFEDFKRANMLDPENATVLKVLKQHYDYTP